MSEMLERNLITLEQARNRVRNAQARAAADRGGYVPGSRGARAMDAEARRIKGEGRKTWSKKPVHVLRYVVVLSRIVIVALEGGGEVREEHIEHIVGPYYTFKQAQRDAKEWTVDSWTASVMPILTISGFNAQEVLDGG